MIRKVEMERLSVISARPFDEVVAAIKASIGNPTMAEFVRSTQGAESAAVPTGIYDLFRIEKGRIAEHWDTLEAIPPRDQRKNSNGKF